VIREQSPWHDQDQAFGSGLTDDWRGAAPAVWVRAPLRSLATATAFTARSSKGGGVVREMYVTSIEAGQVSLGCQED